jgi:hypothetical protein
MYILGMKSSLIAWWGSDDRARAAVGGEEPGRSTLPPTITDNNIDRRERAAGLLRLNPKLLDER